MFKKIKSIFKDVRTFQQNYTLDFASPDTEHILQTLTQQLNHLRVRGVVLGINAWQLLTFVRSSWYYWMGPRQVGI